MRYAVFKDKIVSMFSTTLVKVEYTAIPAKYYPSERRSQVGYIHGHTITTLTFITKKNGKVMFIPIKNIITITKEVIQNDTKGN